MKEKDNQIKETILEVKNITKKYRNSDSVRTVFEKISFNVNNRDLLGIIGKSGSGKTLMVQIILGFENLDSGQINISGKSISEMSKKDFDLLRKDKIALVLRQENLFDFLTVNENINLQFNNKKDKLRYNEVLSIIEIDSILERRVETLNWLEYQKASLAIALLKSPILIIFDEPTGNMTKQESDEFIKILKDINKKTGVAMVVFTHDPAVAVSLNKVVRI